MFLIRIIIGASIIVADILLCSIYCTYQKKRSRVFDNYNKDNNYSGKKDGAEAYHITLKNKIAAHCFRIMESLLRLNLFLVAYFPSHHIRNFIYRFVFKMNIDHTAVIYYGAEIRAPWNISIGKGSIIGDKSVLDARSGIVIGSNVNFSTGVWVWTLQHNVNAVDFGVEGEGKPVIIKNRAWVSCRTVILPGSIIEEGTVIAAGAIVTKSTEPFSIYGGIPCKKIGDRNRNIDYEFDGGHLHFL